MENSVLTDREILESIEEVFQVCKSLDRKALWNAIVPTDAELGCEPPLGQKSVTFIPSFEFFELEAFIALIDSLAKSPSLPEKDKIRLMLTGYCRVMEADLPLAIVWNLLRAASGNPALWTFTRVSKAGDTLTCEYPREKIEEICRMASTTVLLILIHHVAARTSRELSRDCARQNVAQRGDGMGYVTLRALGSREVCNLRVGKAFLIEWSFF